tara:strand:- start:2374 stop:2562 length:189 start_codon:yes stop_codon:yes gene_type:complete
MTKKKNLLTNADAIKELEIQVKTYSAAIQENNAKLLKAQGALEVLQQLEEGVEKPNDSESTD